VRTRYFRARGLLREALSRELDVALEDAFAFDGARCDRSAEGIGQAVDLLFDQAPRLAAQQRLLGPFVVLVHRRLSVKLDNFRHAALLARTGNCLVDHDPGQPCCNAGLAAEAVQIAESQQIGFLQHVLRLGVVLDDAARRAVKRAVVAAHQLFEGG
jgi:hypothetical protein